MTIEIDGKATGADCSGLIKAMKAMQEQTGQSQAVCMRKGVINLLKNLRSRTAQADKQVPKKDVRVYTGDGPHYITPKGTKQRAQHRYMVVRRAPSPDSYGFAHAAASETQARKRFGKISKWGLAKKSWSHATAVLFGRSEAKGGNPKAQIKSGLVEGSMKEIVTGNNPRVEIVVVNKLGYITEATPATVLTDAIHGAERAMEEQTQHYVEKWKRRNGLI